MYFIIFFSIHKPQRCYAKLKIKNCTRLSTNECGRNVANECDRNVANKNMDKDLKK
jgi:hypothetical protein